LENNQLFIFLASGVIKDKGFWLIGIKNSEREIIDDKTLIECHRKELIGLDSAKDVMDAINLNLENLIKDLKNKKLLFDAPPKGISFNIPLDILENIFDFWLDKYKDQEAWETCLGLLKIRRRVPLTTIIESDSIKGDTKKLALEIENLHTYKPNSIEKNTKNEPMWK
tara:strand:- start:144 stop:647 length:504 start_codon:yes stop_codon:yes gene_type:complete